MLAYNTRDGAASSNASDHFRVLLLLLIQAFVLTKMDVSRYERTWDSDWNPWKPIKRKS